MNYKWIGAIFIVLGCGGFGFLIAAASKREEKHLQELYEALCFMSSELQYRLTPLHELIGRAAEYTSGTLWQVFSALDRELVGQIAPNAEACMRTALEQNRNIPVLTGNMLRLLGRSLGKFDLQGQIAGLSLVKEACGENLQRLSKDRVERLRSYRTLGVCAGIALAILLI
jgi:stage III sporulation protein AB